MIEELKSLIALLKDLPALALWIIAGFWVYKVLVIGSIYGLIRFITSKFVEWRKHAITPAPKDYLLATKIALSEETAMKLTAQLMRLTYNSSYIHDSHIEELKLALNHVAAERERKENRNKV